MKILSIRVLAGFSSRLRFATVAAILAGSLAGPAADARERAPVDEYTSEFVQSLTLEAAMGGSRALLVASFALAEHYHIYWRNPGDSGLEPRLRIFQPANEFSLGDIIWPIPDRILVGPLVNYGYTGRIKLPLPLLREGVQINDPRALPEELLVDLRWLVCRIECVPERALLRYRPASPSPEASFEQASKAETIEARLLPGDTAPAGWMAIGLGSWSPTGQATKLDWHLASHDKGLFDLRQPQRLRIDAQTGAPQILVQPGQLFATIVQKARADSGRLEALLLASEPVEPDPAAELVEMPTIDALARPVHILLDLADPELFGDANPAYPDATSPAADEAATLAAWLWAALFAFIGGLILNVMPCVLPVLSIKLSSIIQLAGKEDGQRQFVVATLAQTVGVLAAVMALAGVMLTLKEAEAALGWGFQLQSPGFVLAVAGVMLLVGLNLSGLFSVALPTGGLAGAEARPLGLASKNFLSGILIVVLASPCTAPFMVTAFAFAWQQTTAVALSIFFFLGLGLASPYLALLVSPKTLARLPRPGAWMADVQSVLAFPIYATVLWLVWILSQQGDAFALAWALLALWLAALLAWIYGRLVQRPQSSRLAKIGVLLGVLALAFAVVPATIDAYKDADRGGAASASHPGHSESWSPQRISQIREEGRAVLINFTAAWCATCLWNESRVFSRQEFKDALASSGTSYLIADWTNADPEISRALESYGRRSVPTYVYYPPHRGAEPVILGQLPDWQEVVDLLRGGESS